MRVARMSGRCANGAERDSGRLFHAVESSEHDWVPAICGARPGRLSAGWIDPYGNAITTCPRCLKKMERK